MYNEQKTKHHEQIGQHHRTILIYKANKQNNATEHLIVYELQNKIERKRKIINNKHKAEKNEKQN